MTIRPYALTTDSSEPPHYTENASSALANEDEKSSKKLRVESVKTEQIASAILETSSHKNIDAGLNLLNVPQPIKPLTHQSTAEKMSLIQTIDYNSTDENAYYNLAKLLENEETIELLNGEVYTKKELYLKVIQLNSKRENIYYDLANLLEDEETVKLLSGELYTKKDLYLKATQLNPKHANSYYILASLLEDEETVQLLNGEVYTKKELYLKAIELKPKYINSYYNLAICLKNNEIIQLLSGEVYTKKELYLKGIELNPKDEDCYRDLANLLGDDETIQLLSGEVYTKKELYLKGVELNPKNEDFYRDLTNLLGDDETIQFLSGEVYTKKDLYLKAIELNPKDEDFYTDLANLLGEEETVQLLGGEVYTNKELYLKAIELNPKHTSSYYNLAICLKNHETIQLLSGEIYTDKELYLKGIELNPKDEDFYRDLLNLLGDDETIQLLSGEIYTKKDLYRECIQLNSKDEELYKDLAHLLKNEEMVQLLSGEVYTKKELYLKAIELNPKNKDLYIDLAHCLKDEETVLILNEKIYTKKDIYRKGIDLGGSLGWEDRQYLEQIHIQEIDKNPNNIEGYFGLILAIQDSTALLKNGETVDSEFCFKKGLTLDPIHAFDSQFAPVFFSVASNLYSKAKATIQESIQKSAIEELGKKSAIEERITRELILKQGVSLTLKNEEVISTKALYQHALPLLSSGYLKCRGDEGVGDYLSSRKHIVLQDEIKLTKLMAYRYAYQKRRGDHILIKIGDALHPEERTLLNGIFYDKRGCYEKAILDREYGMHKRSLRIAESLSPNEHLRKKELFHQALEEAYDLSEDYWEAYTTLARILSQYELKGLESKYLWVFEEELQYYGHIEDKDFTSAMDSADKSSVPLDINDDLYFAKKQQFLMELLKYVPSCEEAYVALATSFQQPLMIHEKSYTSKEALYLKAIDLNPEYSLPYFLLGKELFNQKIENVLLLNGVKLSCKQLLMRSIQLGTYEAGAYHLAALMMHDREGIYLFDGTTILSRGDLFIRAFERDFTRVIDLKNFLSYVKRSKECQLKR